MRTLCPIRKTPWERQQGREFRTLIAFFPQGHGTPLNRGSWAMRTNPSHENDTNTVLGIVHDDTLPRIPSRMLEAPKSFKDRPRRSWYHFDYEIRVMRLRPSLPFVRVWIFSLLPSGLSQDIIYRSRNGPSGTIPMCSVCMYIPLCGRRGSAEFNGSLRRVSYMSRQQIARATNSGLVPCNLFKYQGEVHECCTHSTIDMR